MVRTVYILLRIKVDRMKNVTDPPVQYFTPCLPEVISASLHDRGGCGTRGGPRRRAWRGTRSGTRRLMGSGQRRAARRGNGRV